MSAEAAALMRAIRDCPDDDLPRLALADFLAEHGDPDRGEFVRAQVELSRLPEDDPRRPALEDRAHELLAEHEADWLAGLLGDPADPDAAPHDWRFERGFLVDVAATPLFLLDHGPDLFADHPVRRWRVASSQENMPADLAEAGRRGWAGRLEAVDLSGWYQEIGELERFLVHCDLGGLRELDLTDRPGLDYLPEILGRAPFREALQVLRCGSRQYPGAAGRLDLWDLVAALESTRLTELSAPGAVLTSGDVRVFLAARCADALTRLGVPDNQIEPDGWDAFQAARCRLRDLDLGGTPLGAIALDRVLEFDALSNLRVLDVSRCGSAVANLRGVARSRFWRQAEGLRMRGATVPSHAPDPLFASAGPPGLRALDMAGNYLRDAAVADLCAAPWVGSLTELDLAGNHLTDDAARAIASSGRFTRLRSLYLSHTHPMYLEGEEPGEGVTAAGVRALADGPSLANLRVLDLAGTQLTPAAVDAVINGPHWRLAELRLWQCDLTPAAVRVLADSPGLARLTRLDLVRNTRLNGDALMPLAESEHLCRLTELDVRGVYLDPDTRAALRQRLGRRLRTDW